MEEVTENGICVGSALDPGRVIPKHDNEAKAYATLHELFAASFGAWGWNSSEGHYGDKAAFYFGDKSAGSTSITPTPPKIYSLKTSTSYTPSGFTWGTENSFSVIGLDKKPQDSGLIQASGSFPATLNFFAFADNDQMPITRLAVDWGDGSDPYEVRGWFKNRKPYCNEPTLKVCKQSGVFDLNRPCQFAGDCIGGTCELPSNSKDQRLHFGNSASACQLGYYQFTHLYTCKGPATCVFKPKVQVLDNWGWCNGTCQTVGGTTGCWDDSGLADTPKLQECSIDNIVNKDKHWTSFVGTITITP